MRRKWLAPNNASRQQMGFNSGFKGLSYEIRAQHINFGAFTPTTEILPTPEIL